MHIKSKTHPRLALVAYGSETGTASDYAEELGRMLERLHFTSFVSKLDSIQLSSLSSFTFVLLVSSTTGQGELPNNARKFWKSLLRRKLGPRVLEDVKFSTFGLGDSSYHQYNWAIRKIHKRITQLGAVEIYPRGEADEQHDAGLDAAFIPWVTDLRKELLGQFPLQPGLSPIPEDHLLTPKWLLSLAVFHPETDRHGMTRGTPETTHQAQQDTTASHIPELLAVTLVENKRMTPQDHWQDVRHLAFTSKSSASYGPGDVLTILPRNTAEDVDMLIERMQWKDTADKVIEFTSIDALESSSLKSSPPIKLPAGNAITFRKLLTEHLDLTAIPRRSFFSLVAHFTSDRFHKERLLEFTKPEFIDELYDYTTRPRRSILEVLQEFDSVMIPWQWAANILPELRGRQFSIASGGQLKADAEGNARFELLVAIVKFRTVIKKIREGVCTRYLAGLEPGAQLAVSLQKGGLGITRAEAFRPVVMIGPGTGVAPMRSLIYERLQWLRERGQDSSHQSNGHTDGRGQMGKSLLMYGCRNEFADYFYQDEWESLKHQMPLEVHAAFSRDQAAKVYVQDVIRRQGGEIFRLLRELEGTVYVCGSSGKMPTAVRAALVDVFREHGNMDHEDALIFLEDMEKKGRYKQETWG